MCTSLERQVWAILQRLYALQQQCAAEYQTINLEQAIALGTEALHLSALNNDPIEQARAATQLARIYIQRPAGQRAENLMQAAELLRFALDWLHPDAYLADRLEALLLVAKVDTETSTIIGRLTNTFALTEAYDLSIRLPPSLCRAISALIEENTRFPN